MPLGIFRQLVDVVNSRVDVTRRISLPQTVSYLSSSFATAAVLREFPSGISQTIACPQPLRRTIRSERGKSAVRTVAPRYPDLKQQFSETAVRRQLSLAAKFNAKDLEPVASNLNLKLFFRRPSLGRHLLK